MHLLTLFVLCCLVSRAVEALTWRCRHHSIRWLALSLLAISSLIGIVLFLPHIIGVDFSYWLVVPSLAAWSVVSTAYDLAHWFLFPAPETVKFKGRNVKPKRINVTIVVIALVISVALGFISFPCVAVLATANALSPPHRLKAETRRSLLCFYPHTFVDTIVLIPEKQHPISKIVNFVMSGIDNNNNSDDDGCGSGESAGAFALFNLVFSSPGDGRLLLVEEDITTLVHECVHCRQQSLSTSMLSFLSVYLAQYAYNSLLDGKDAYDAYRSIAAERQAYGLEKTKGLPFRPVDDALETGDEADNCIEVEKYTIWSCVDGDFYKTLWTIG